MDTLNQLGGAYGDSVFLGIGRNYPWPDDDQQVAAPVTTIDGFNQVHRDLAALKKLSISNASLVVQRKDWVANTYVYDKFSESADMYSYTTIANANGTATFSNTNQIYGVNTTFTQDFSVGDFILFNGDGVISFPVMKEVVAIGGTGYLTTNSNVSGSYTQTTMQNVSNAYPSFAHNFYTRNSYDQVFLCLDNNNGAISSAMPQISLAGQLPTDPYIITSDGYKWKYLYTISGGAKKLFLTSEYMPVGIDNTVIGAAVDGRIDIVDIVSGGQGYNANVAACSAPILVLTGDGTGANVTAQVDSNGTINFVNVLNGGSGYTTASITANTGANGSGAVFTVTTGPRGGYGSNAALQLGATTLMISTSLSDTENGTIPVEDVNGEFFTYRQLSLILNPTLQGTSNVATNTNYDMTTVIQVSPLSNNIFNMGDIAFQNFTNGTLAGASFYGTVVWYDSSTQNLHLNNIGGTGTFIPQSPIKGVSRSAPANAASYITATAFLLTEPPLNTFSGVDCFIQNMSPIQRYPQQVEEIRLIISF